MSRTILLVLTGLCLCAHMQAQTWPVIPSPSVINSTGGVINQSGGSFVEFSVGEMAVTSLNIGGNPVGFTQGVLQPILSASFVINTHEVFDEKYQFKCYPNPVSDFIAIETDYPNFTGMQLMNVQGQLIREIQFNYTPIDCTVLPSGTYFVRLFSETKPESKTFKLVKQ